ncbi:uncharacterized protein L969DRAFT_94840 [Mixia osmundae IAM 14324]|uniref:Uncharacterized protein n=1 Tax=Mixia osmundae (strain CBS 9802 / IAM 14324 / JCM 22182 / KY 12970) TaxID=764103 RepID=G7DYZ4_MIXOS|nr:uncharacterized protein L969DRAFT_94840 [Mixia osmundae IAM 14324]KEI38635.1 hypothetical protein L969DRAFT_94840 [Mixia osmundae IAM 14324]GAA95804.1 hypothetical protein E5Q_02461 [Mixia osmundae IAM 14324]
MPLRRPGSDQRPPAYASVVQRVYGRTLRPVIILQCIIGLLYGAISGARWLRDTNDTGETTRLKTFDIILGVLLLLVALIEMLGLHAAVLQRAKFARLYFIASTVAAALTLTIGLVRIVVHFVAKSDIIAQCVLENQGAQDDDGVLLTDAQLTDACNSSWSSGTYFDIGWLIVTVLLSLLWASTAAGYYHELQAGTKLPSDRYQLNAYAPQDAPFQPGTPWTANTAPPYTGYSAPQTNPDGLPIYDQAGFDGQTADKKDRFGQEEEQELDHQQQSRHLYDDLPRRSTSSNDSSSTVVLNAGRESEARV